jgi:hypothetical protein
MSSPAWIAFERPRNGMIVLSGATGGSKPAGAPVRSGS